MAVDELVDRLAILVAARRVPRMGVAYSRSLRYESDVRLQHFVRRSTCVPFRRFWGMCDVNSCNVFMLPFMVLLWVPISATFCKRAVLTLWHAFLFLGRSFPPLFFFLSGGLHCFFF
jgi:hypothetical protein